MRVQCDWSGGDFCIILVETIVAQGSVCIVRMNSSAGYRDTHTCNYVNWSQ
jgi:hypothetical protein